MTDAPAEPSGPDPARLLGEAATKSGMLWVRVPGAGDHAVWHVWRPADEDADRPAAVLVVSGPGEQHLPWLPADVVLVLRSKDSGGRLLTVPAVAAELEPGSAEWQEAVDLLRPVRLNATGDVEGRWRESATVHALVPDTAAVARPTGDAEGSGAAPVRPAGPATARWRPWHLRGRAGGRRRTAG
ncbi:hypothetical protein KC207_06570 [Phycicoccus sp. BSK3Z-2]|uniref:Uncharacterized protein n=1 Tax=Phycicoccus avicenniae TaxID=2828860 RepID=A0A941D742_9MICO|nr:hypothetical protein [Phycicoccus avicenniae]MBR7742948.1 hypothetical protein [Phycicoccus avicenniae]